MKMNLDPDGYWDNAQQPTVNKSKLNDWLDGFDGVEVTAIDKYRSDSLVNTDCDRARVVLDLKFPKHLKLYYELKKMAD